MLPDRRRRHLGCSTQAPKLRGGFLGGRQEEELSERSEASDGESGTRPWSATEEPGGTVGGLGWGS